MSAQPTSTLPDDGLVLDAHDLRITSGAGPIVTGLSIQVPRAGTLAIVGESGSGKSMVAKAVTGLLPPGVTATGSLTLAGRPVALDGRESAWRDVRGATAVLLMQDPFTSLSPVHRCGPQILAGARGIAKSEREAFVTARLAEVGLEPHIARRYPFELSGGMRQRVAIAAALACEPALLIADEPTTALDVTTQAEILDLLDGLRAARQMGVILITHDLELAHERADSVVVLYAGRQLERGAATDVLRNPAHPYTRALHAANPPLDIRLDRLPAIAGSVPRAGTVVGRCPFADRCPSVHDLCTAAEPALVEIVPGRWSACVLGAAPLTSTTAAPVSVPSPPEHLPIGDAPELIVVGTGLTKTYAGASVRALDAVDVEVRSGEAVGIVGESGSGKTTLARCLVGLESIDDGEFRFLGSLRPASGAGRPPRSAIQIVFQDPYSALNPRLSIKTTLTEALHVAGRSADDVPELLDLVGLPQHYASRKPRALSGGERQRVAIARALAPRPTLLVCDESVSALDVSVQAQVLNLLTDLRTRLGLSLVFISHDLAVVRQVADRIYVMHRGVVVEHGTADHVLADPEHPYTRTLMASVPGASRRTS